MLEFILTTVVHLTTLETLYTEEKQGKCYYMRIHSHHILISIRREDYKSELAIFNRVMELIPDFSTILKEAAEDYNVLGLLFSYVSISFVLRSDHFSNRLSYMGKPGLHALTTRKP